MGKIPRVAVIQDMSGFGRCSLTVAIPTLSAMGVQCCPITTAYLSTHTGGFSGMAKLDMTVTLKESVAHWAGMGLKFDGVYTGYLSSPEQAELAIDGVKRLKGQCGLAVIDPACGDNGKLYSGCTPALWEGLEWLCAHGDVILPNLTEAAFLLGLDWESLSGDGAAGMELARRLSAGGKRSVVLTGVTAGENRTGAACFDRERGECCLVSAPRHPGEYPGTGDLFASVVTGGLMQGQGLFEAAQRATDFVSSCVAFTRKNTLPVREGVAFEPLLGQLIPVETKTQTMGTDSIPADAPFRRVLPVRPRAAHKGDFGRVFILAGAEGYTGAPVLAASAAVRTGAGLVFLGVPKGIYPIVAAKCGETMPFPLPEEYEAIHRKAAACDVALIGPGLGRSAETDRLARRLLMELNIPVVLDADGINALAGHIDILDKRTALTVLTPHEGEFQRLTGCPLPVPDRLEAAKGFAAAHRCVLILKGQGTVTAAPSGRAWVCGKGNPGMARGGSGDVLAGMLAALLGQKPLTGRYPAEELMAMGVQFHAEAGDLCAQRMGEYGMTPSDMVEAIPEVLRGHAVRLD